MKPLMRWTLMVVVILAAGGAGWWLGHRGRAGGAEEAAGDSEASASAEVKPTLDVKTVPIRRGEIEETLTAYGTVASQSAEVGVLSVPFESRVTRMLVSAGQEVAAGTPLLEVEPSPAARLATEEAQNAVDAAQRALDQTQQRYNEKLGTNTELLTAQTDLRTAKAKLLSIQQGQSGGTKGQTLRALSAGLVSKIDVQLGQIVPAAAPLIELASQQRIEVKLGIEPEDVEYLKIGQEVRISRPDLETHDSILGRIRLISQRINPDTRMVDALVTLPRDAHLLLDGFVVGQLAKRTSAGLVAPREAVLPDDEGNLLYTVEGGKAVAHKVELGVQSATEVEVRAPELKAGDAVVVEGNYELENGMSVAATTQPATTEGATTERATTEAATTEPATTDRSTTESATSERPPAAAPPAATTEAAP